MGTGALKVVRAKRTITRRFAQSFPLFLTLKRRNVVRETTKRKKGRSFLQDLQEMISRLKSVNSTKLKIIIMDFGFVCCLIVDASNGIGVGKSPLNFYFTFGS